MTMERSEIVKKLWELAQHCHDDDGNLYLFGSYIAHSDYHPPDTWIFQPGDPIWINNREGIISQLIGENMNNESRSKIAVIFDGTDSERFFTTKEILTKENSDSFLVSPMFLPSVDKQEQVKQEQVLARRTDPNKEVRALRV